MKLAISNIAWNQDEDSDVLGILKKYKIPGIEVAPTMVWKDPTRVSTEAIKNYRKFWNDEGIVIESIQAVLYGHPELRIFENKKKRDDTLDYIKNMLRVCAQLGVKDIVFGSPANRDRGTISIDNAFEIARDFFRKIGEVAKTYDIVFCIEPIPKVYGTNFINNSEEGISLVKSVDHPNFKLHLDSGAMTVAKEDYRTAIVQAEPYLNHFHISDKDLMPIGTTDVDHKEISSALNHIGFKKWLSIEMRRKDRASNVKVIDETLQYVTKMYL